VALARRREKFAHRFFEEVDGAPHNSLILLESASEQTVLNASPQ
jgi:hypothetical protein